jgi:hypothetical protein
MSGEKLAAFLVLKKTGYSKTLLSVESVGSYWALERAGSHSPFSRLLQHFSLLQPWLFSLVVFLAFFKYFTLCDGCGAGRSDRLRCCGAELKIWP